MKDTVAKILELKERKNATILAHFYQDGVIQDIADFVGDSLELAKKATEIDSSIVVMCGVYFMAETVKILNPDKKVLIPYPKAGCLMADMVLEEELAAFKKENPDYAVVTYVNSTAGVKSIADICCTSANAVSVVASLDKEKIMFVPDKNLGSYIAEQVKEKEIVCWEGYCPVHDKLLPEDIVRLKREYPDAKVIVHPECRKEVRDLADFTGSTSKLLTYVKNSRDKKFIIGTEKGIIHQFKKIKPDGIFIPSYGMFICDQMKLITPLKLLKALEEEIYEVEVDKETAGKAFLSIDRMLKVK